MISNVKFIDNAFQLAMWCFNTLERNGIHELKGVDELLGNGQRYLQLCLKSRVGDSEIFLEKVREDQNTHEPIYQFVYKLHTNLTHTARSTEFMLNKK